MMTLQIALILLCIAGAAFYSGMETGIISIRRLRLRHHAKEGNRDARILMRFLDHPDRLLGTTLVGTNLCMVMGSVLSASVAARWPHPAAKAVATVSMTLTFLVFSEYIPKSWFRAAPYYHTVPHARRLYWSWFVFRPVGGVITWIAGLLLPGRRDSTQATLTALATRQELKLLASEVQEYGELTPEERTMIHRVIELSETPSSAIMTPRSRVASISIDDHVEDFIAVARASQFQRFPVCDPATDKFVGIVNTFDVLTSGTPDLQAPISRYMRTPVLVRADIPSDDVLPLLRIAGQTMGIVTDADGTALGIVTTEDILKHILGNLPAQGEGKH